MAKPGVLTAVTGRTRTGKGQAVIADLKCKKASLVWDPKGDPTDYPCRARCTTIPALAAVLKVLDKGMICYTGRPEDLDFFCRLAWLFVEKFGADGAVVFDEMASTSNPGKAQGAYGNFLRQSLYKGSDVYVMAQAAAESDKTAFRCAMRFYFTAPGTVADKKYIQELTRVPMNLIDGMAAVFAENHHDSYFDLFVVVKDLHYEKRRLTLKAGKPKYKTIINKTAF